MSVWLMLELSKLFEFEVAMFVGVLFSVLISVCMLFGSLVGIKLCEFLVPC